MSQQEQIELDKLKTSIEDYLLKQKTLENAKKPPISRWSVITEYVKDKATKSFNYTKKTFTGSIRIYTETIHKQNDTHYMRHNAQLALEYGNPSITKKNPNLLKSSNGSLLDKLKNSTHSKKEQTTPKKFKPVDNTVMDQILSNISSHPSRNLPNFADEFSTTDEQSQDKAEESSSEQSSYVLSAGISSPVSYSSCDDNSSSSSSASNMSNNPEPGPLNHNAIQQNKI
ncbi:hypothetical protein [Legionella tunisiensis]|uniref:hypothetical protein n=1 Tax=Legionella tunisiensis TaxID=1034944 RepID=UPI000307EFC5|nr:hypothetical protein [Legionella tunisiensis]